MDAVPFTTEDELYHKLHNPHGNLERRLPPQVPPDALNNTNTHLPGQPRIALHDTDSVEKYLNEDLMTEDLNKIAPHLWLVAKQDSSHVSSLTHQIIRGRQITITEKPGLHLVWIYDRVFIKPMPKYLLSHDFWKYYFVNNQSPIPQTSRRDLVRAALGFLRSYSYLIRHKSDYILARHDRLGLLPKGVSYLKFVNFIKAFESIEDRDVSPRYEYGELRLTRLNFWSKIFLWPRFTYQKVYGQYGAYFARFYGPLLFIFGVFSVALSAMQVALAVQPVIPLNQSWVNLAQVSKWFSVVVLVCISLVVLYLLCLILTISLREITFACKDLYKRRRTGGGNDADG
ncbi:MAG: hypothetical protein M1834_008337 [Cirrosporium novae-zelandiae]|nr:MAG: hypothetical protein M1834_008337 [Cirrosporium novae-zelandiae]